MERHELNRKSAGLSRSVLLLILALPLAGIGAFFLIGDETQHKDAAIELYRSGDFVAAANAFDRLLGSDAPDPEVVYYAALCEVERKNYEKGGDFLASLRKDPVWRARAYYHTIIGFMRAGRAEEVRLQVEKPDDRLKNEPLVHEARGLYFLARVEDAEKQIHEAISQKLGDRRARASYQGQTIRILRATTSVYDRSLDAVIERLKATQQFDDTVPIQILYDRGHQQLIAAATEFEKAIEASDKSKDQPDAVRSRYELSEIYRIRGQISDSAQILRSLLDLEKERLRGDRYFEHWHAILVNASRRNLAEVLVDKQNWKEALSVLESTPRDDEGNYPFEIDLMIATCHAGADRPGKMLEIVDRWLAKDPAIYSMNYLKGKYLFEQGDNLQALIYLDRSLNKGRGSKEYLDTLARCYMALGRFANANALLEQLVEMDPRNVEYILLRGEAMAGLDWREDTISFYIDTMRKSFPDRTSEANRLIRARLNEFMLKFEMTPKSLYAAEQLYARDPENFLVARRYIELLTQAKNWKLARTITDEVLQTIRPSDIDYHEVLMASGRLYLETGHWLLAVESFDRAAKARPSEPEAYLGQCEAEIALGRIGRAWEALEKAKVVGPELTRARYLEFRLCQIDGDHASAASIGDQLLKDDAKDTLLIQNVARAHLSAGDTKAAGKLLDRLKTVAFRDFAAAVEYGELLLRAGRTVDGERTLSRICTDNPGNVDVSVDVAAALMRFQRYDAVIRILAPLASSNPETAAPALKILAQAHEAKGDLDSMLSVFSAIRFAGERNWVYDRVASFCRQNGAFDEGLSVIQSAVADQAATASLLETAVRIHIDLRDYDKAFEWAQVLKQHPSANPIRAAIVEARVLELQREIPAAITLLEKQIKNASQDDAKAIRRTQIEILGRAGLVEQMAKTLETAYGTITDPSGLAEIATHFLVVADNADASAWMNETIKREGETATALLDRGILAFGDGDVDAAIADFERSLAKTPSRDALFGLACAQAAKGEGKTAESTLAKGPKDLVRPAMTNAVRMISALMANDGSKAADACNGLELGTRAELDDLRALVAAAFTDAQALEALRTSLPRFLFLRTTEAGIRKAVRALRTFGQKMPGRQRTIDFLMARTYLSVDWGFLPAIQIVQKYIVQEHYDETAIQIYAENYVAARNGPAISDLLRVVLKETGFSSSFYLDLAHTFIDGGYPKDAARVLYASPDDSTEKSLLAAVAHYRAGQIEQAGLKLLREPKLPNEPIYHEIMAAYRMREAETLQEAFRFASEAVYRLDSTSPTAQLVLAEIAFKIDNLPEAQKSVRRALALDPASARTAIAALSVVNRFAEKAGFELRDWLDDRKNVLDPAQRVARLVNAE